MTLIHWFQQNAAPRWLWLLILAGIISERLLARSKRPWARSGLSLVAFGLRILVVRSGLAMIPAIGPILVRALEVIAGADIDGDGKIGDPSRPAADDDPTKPGVDPPTLPPGAR